MSDCIVLQLPLKNGKKVCMQVRMNESMLLLPQGGATLRLRLRLSLRLRLRSRSRLLVCISV